MAKFEEAFNITMGHEGGYSKDPTDAGGETYRGISRKYFPNWSGWGIIDSLKGAHLRFPKNLRNREFIDKINPMVMSFYKINFWDKFWGNVIMYQNVANEMFDTAVNMSITRAILFLQQSLNFLNRNQKLFLDVVEDGYIGKNTINALESLPRKDIDILLKMMNVLQARHYMEYMKKSPKQEKYARGWFSRVIINK